jgi:PAS domain S-box-containing protein
LSKKKFKELRIQAEEQLATKHRQIESLDRADLVKMAHELAVHQVELEIQNEELRVSRTEAEEARDRYLDLFDFAPVGYFTVDEHGRIVEANLTGCQLLKTERQSLLKKNFAKFIIPEEADIFYLYRKKVMENGSRYARELTMQKSDGATFNAQLEGIKTGEGRIRIAVIDITELKKASRLKDEFIGMVSHEIKTPLTVIIGALSTVTAEGVTRPEARELLQDAIDHADILATIVDNLLELSRSQADRLVLQKEPTDVRGIAQAVVEKLRGKSSIHQLMVDIPTGLPLVNVDPLRAERVLYNLVDNAIKYSPNGGEVKISARQEKENMIVSVSDHGLGISQDDQQRLFQKFQRLDVMVKRSIQGIGLGLNVCRILVEAHGGQIWVESKKGKGSTFFFTIPLGK